MICRRRSEDSITVNIDRDQDLNIGYSNGIFIHSLTTLILVTDPAEDISVKLKRNNDTVY